MVAQSVLVANVAVLLGAVVGATPAAAVEPTISVADEPHDVTVFSEVDPGFAENGTTAVTITEAEQRSIELEWFTAAPQSNGRVRFKVKIVEVRRTPRFKQGILIGLSHVPTSTGDWTQAMFAVDVGRKLYWYALLTSGATEAACAPHRVRVNRAADTVSVGIPNRCVPRGEAEVFVDTDTMISDGMGGAAQGSSDGLKVRGAVR